MLATLYTHRHTVRFADSTAVCAIELLAPADLPAKGIAGQVIGTLYLGVAADDSAFRPSSHWGGYGPLALDLPVDDQQYAFTHGTDRYRAAVRATWAWLRIARSDWFAASDGEHVWGIGDSPAAALEDARRGLEERWEPGDARVGAVLATLHTRPISAERRAAIVRGTVAS